MEEARVKIYNNWAGFIGGVSAPLTDILGMSELLLTQELNKHGYLGLDAYVLLLHARTLRGMLFYYCSI